MPLEAPIKTTEEIRDSLRAEIELARGERVLIRNMDVSALNQRALKRGEFNQRTAQLQLRLADQLRTIAAELGLAEVTLAALTARLPAEGRKLGAAFGDIRALATALSELDVLNRALGQRALSYVKAHLAVLCPRSVSYDRRGGSPLDPRTSTHVRVA